MDKVVPTSCVAHRNRAYQNLRFGDHITGLFSLPTDALSFALSCSQQRLCISLLIGPNNTFGVIVWLLQLLEVTLFVGDVLLSFINLLPTALGRFP
jgi:hypothetical protein